jgi:hypothetical protein
MKKEPEFRNQDSGEVENIKTMGLLGIACAVFPPQDNKIGVSIILPGFSTGSPLTGSGP